MFDLDITFQYPAVLLLSFVFILIYFFYYKYINKKNIKLPYPQTEIFTSRRKSFRERTYLLPDILKFLALLLFIIALSRPQSLSKGEIINTEGIDIAIVLDISGSMLAEDFSPNRLEAAKKITDNFIQNRTNDQIGLVIFSREAFTQCPLTIDYNVLRNLLKDIKSGMIDDGTAIGNAIANGINRLKSSKAKSKVIILLTDGMNNAGEINPLTAAEIAQKFNIRIYTIGVGTIGQAPYPFQTPFGVRYQMVPVEIDENLLKQIANTTNGKYFRATDNKKLEAIYAEINSLEKTKIEVLSYSKKREYFYPFLILGLALLLFEFLLSKTFYRTLP